jgi:hypothetical protein
VKKLRQAGLLLPFALLAQLTISTATRAGDNAPHLDTHCADPVNLQSTACSLWRTVVGCIGASAKCSTDETFIKHVGQDERQHTLFNPDQKSCTTAKGPGHWIIVPTGLVTGIEDTKHRDSLAWTWAWAEAETAKIPHQDIALAINPITERSQHQLHIHIGKIKDCQDCDMRRVINNPMYRDGQWHKNIAIHDTYKGQVRETKYDIIFVNKPSPSSTDPFANPFARVSQHVGEENMACQGIIVAGAEKDTKSGEEGFYILNVGGTYNKDNHHCTYSAFVQGRIDDTCPQ